MYQRVFRYQPSMKGKQMYQQLECIECLKLTNKMLRDEAHILIENRKRFQAKQKFINNAANQKLKHQIRPIREEAPVIGPNNRRPKSNFSTTTGGAISSKAAAPQDITLDQATEMLASDPTVFMAQTY